MSLINGKMKVSLTTTYDMSRKGPPAFVEGKWDVSPYNYHKEVLSTLKLPKKITFCDTTLREGQEGAGVIFTTKDKVKVAQKLDEVGLPVIQVAMSVQHKAKEEIQAISALKLKSEISVVILPNDIDNVADWGANWVELVVQPDPAIAIKAIEKAHERGMKIRCAINMIGIQSLEFIGSYFKAVAEAGADELYIADSQQASCILSPSATRYIVSYIRQIVPDVPLAYHCHNELGTATANAIAAVEAGADVLDVNVNGLGGVQGSGNVALEEMAVILPALYGIETGIKTEKLLELCTLVSDVTKVPIRDHKPIVGKFAFSNAGYVMKHAIEPSLVGNRPKIFFGAYTMPFTVKAKTTELGLPDVPDSLMQKVCVRIVEELELRKRVLTDDEFKAILKEVK